MNITSASNRQKTLLRKLNRKKYRQQEQRFLIGGCAGCGAGAGK
ncbi:MAG: hypothetical protein U5J63_16155 [Fodinibius sp.]|nr:hypothetical protein [Fodinibius sp.]